MERTERPLATGNQPWNDGVTNQNPPLLSARYGMDQQPPNLD